MKALSVQAISAMCIALAYGALAAGPGPEAVGAAAPATNAPGPRIEFQSPIYDFGKLVAGQTVRHDYIFTNTGSEVLQVTDVRPSCGCTVAQAWTRTVEPGKTGIIPLMFNSGHFNGPVAKTANVMSNDKAHPQTVLQIRGTIWKPVQVIPQTAVLNVVADAPSNAPAVVKIVSSLAEPLVLSEPVSQNSLFAAELQTNVPGKEFQVMIRTTGPVGQGTTQGTISMKTSSTNVPSIDVTAFAFAQPAWVISPAAITLQPGPLPNPFPRALSIRNNNSILVTLSEAALNVSNVPVQLREVVPGRQFTLVMNFPAGFRVEPGQDVFLRVKTSDPLKPLIEVPVRQAVSPAGQRSGAELPRGLLTPPPPASIPPALPEAPASSAFQVN